MSETAQPSTPSSFFTVRSIPEAHAAHVMPLEQIDNFVYRSGIAALHLLDQTAAHMVFQHIRRQTFDGLIRGGKLNEHVLAVPVLFNHLFYAAKLTGNAV